MCVCYAEYHDGQFPLRLVLALREFIEKPPEAHEVAGFVASMARRAMEKLSRFACRWELTIRNYLGPLTDSTEAARIGPPGRGRATDCALRWR
jgi:hypothetical protein